MKTGNFLIMRAFIHHTTSRVLCTLFIIIGVTISLSGQNTGVYKKLYYSIYLSNSGSTEFLKDKKVHKSTLKSLKNFYSDKRARSRSRAYSLARNIYNNSEDKERNKRACGPGSSGGLPRR